MSRRRSMWWLWGWLGVVGFVVGMSGMVVWQLWEEWLPDDSAPLVVGREGAGRPGVRVALVGDMSTSDEARAVLELVRFEGADVLVVLGDLGYDERDPAAPYRWDSMVTQVLGSAFPLAVVQGNHDVAQWEDYAFLFETRLPQMAGMDCEGEVGRRSVCTFGGVRMVLDDGQQEDAFFAESLAAADEPWRICGWHYTQPELQVGGKRDAVGLGRYEACRVQGAIVVNGHEHSYSRTKTLVNMAAREVAPGAPGADRVVVDEGATFVAVSGLGGHSVRGQRRCLPTVPPYGCKGEWAKIYTADQGATAGVLFFDFYGGLGEREGRGYFKTIGGEVVDEFVMRSGVGV